MTHAYTVILLLLLGISCGIHGATIDSNRPLNAMDRVRNFLEKRCMKYAGQLKHQAALQALNYLTTDCFPFKPPPGSITQTTAECQIHTEFVLDCIIDFTEKLEPCLDPQEIFLKRFVIDTYNEWAKDSCQNIGDLIVTALFKTDLKECISKFQERPETSPHVVCYTNSTVIGDNANEDAVKKEELCSELQSIDSCYTTVFNEHCPGYYEIEDLQKGFITAAIKNC